MENVITELIDRGKLDETLSQSFNRWSRYDTSMQMLVKRNINDPGFITPVVAFVKQRVISTVEDELKRETQVTMKNPSIADPSLSAFTGVTSDKQSKHRRSLQVSRS